MRSHLPRVLNDFDVLLAEFIGVELQEPLGNFRQRRELRLLVDILFPILVLEEALLYRNKCCKYIGNCRKG